MTKRPLPHRLSTSLVSRRGACSWLAVALVTYVLGVLLLADYDAPARGSSAPPDSESVAVSELLDTFGGGDTAPVLLVATREDGTDLSDADVAAVQGLTDLGPLASTDAPRMPPRLSDDNTAAVAFVPIIPGADNSSTAGIIKDLRSAIADNKPTELNVAVTGGPAFGADIASAFDGADFTLLLVTVAIVAVLLIITYRSPVLWLLPLAVVGLADHLAGMVTTAIADLYNVHFDAGIISVLVFGAGANYALLLISRYREELYEFADHRAALAAAWRGTLGAIVASNVTVVLALLTLAAAVVPGTRGLGVTAAAGLIVALLAVLFALPPVLALAGRRAFWPLIPAPQQAPRSTSAWTRTAHKVMARPAVSCAVGFSILAVMAMGLLGTSVGLEQSEKFRTSSESAAGLETLSEHFNPGAAQPLDVVASTDRVDDVLAAAQSVDGVVRAVPTKTSDDESLTHIVVTADSAPSSERSMEVVAQLRTTLGDIPGAAARVGGASAGELDARDGARHDLLLVAPLIVGVSLAILALLTRSVVAPAVLVTINLASALAAIGAGSWLGRVVFDQPALDTSVPLLAFVFLVALGIDYTIFLTHRARQEAAVVGTREGMTAALGATGAVITSAGVVLAGVFTALGLLPLVTLGQLGLIVGIGVLVDTVVVRSVIVPSVFGLAGDAMWWPNAPQRSQAMAAAVSDSRSTSGAELPEQHSDHQVAHRVR